PSSGFAAGRAATCSSAPWSVCVVVSCMSAPRLVDPLQKALFEGGREMNPVIAGRVFTPYPAAFPCMMLLLDMVVNLFVMAYILRYIVFHVDNLCTSRHNLWTSPWTTAVQPPETGPLTFFRAPARARPVLK